MLEIGIGSGLNLPFYDRDSVTALIGLDPSPALLAKAHKAAVAAGIALTTLEGSAESIPLESSSIDTVVMTWTLCSINDPARALAEIRRVLKPGGRLLFVEHGRAPDAGVLRWQRRLTPLWKRCSGGCHLDRPIDGLIEEAGFGLERIDRAYMDGPRLFTFMYEGAARRYV